MLGNQGLQSGEQKDVIFVAQAAQGLHADDASFAARKDMKHGPAPSSETPGPPCPTSYYNKIGAVMPYLRQGRSP
ncbi:hypothetical protein JCM17960_05710 [Magnetospira thiophila]